MIAKPSAEPTPRPPLTTTFASASETPPPAAATRSSDAHAQVRVGERRRERLDRGAPPRRRLGGDDVRRDGERAPASRAARASSSRLPPQRMRVTRDRVARRRRDAVGRERQVEPRGDVREHLVAAVGAGGDDRAPAASRAGEPRPRDAAQASGANAAVERLARDATCAEPRRARAPQRPRRRRAAPTRTASTGASPEPTARETPSACSESSSASPPACSTKYERSQSGSREPQLRQHLDDGGRGLGAVAEDLAPACPTPAAARSAQLLEPRRRPRRRARAASGFDFARSRPGTDG